MLSVRAVAVARFLEPSHTISQGISSPSGSYWHGIMHRREPDYANAKYWFRRVGPAPDLSAMWETAAELAQDRTTESLATEC